MLLDFVDVTNFRGIARATLQFGRLNVFTGPNQAGKSSLKAAIEYAITRRNEWTDGRGNGIKTQVRHGSKAGKVRIVIGGNLEVEAECPPEKNAAQKAGQLYAALGLRHDVALSERLVQSHLRACELLDQPADEQKAALCRALRLELDGENFTPLVNALDGRWPELAQWFDEQTATLGYRGTFGAEGFLKFAREQRPAAKRARDDQQRRVEHLEAVLGSGRPSGTPEKAAEARARLEDVVRQLAELDAGRAPAVQVHQAHVREWQARSDARASAEQALHRAEVELREANAKIWGMRAPERSIEEIQALRQAAEAEAQRLQGVLGESFTMSEEPCKRGQCRVREMLEHRKAQAELHAQSRAAAATKDALHLELEAAMAYRLVTTRVAEAEQRVGAARDALAQAPEAGESPPAPAAEVDPRRAELEQLHAVAREQVEIADAMAHQALLYETQVQDLEQARERLLVLQDEAERWECLCRAFDTKAADSLPSRLLSDGIGPFAVDVDAACVKHFGFGVRFELDPWGIYIETATGLVPQDQACGGERVALSAAIQVELAHRTGFRLIMIDEAQRLDAERRPLLASYLLQHDVQALIFLAAQEKTVEGGRVQFTRPTPPAHPDIRFWWVSEGTFELIERTAVATKGA